MKIKNFGRDIKALRTKQKIGSRELSRLIGKAETYISQLERGLIKKPDYDTSYKIMKHLGYGDKKIPLILESNYDILSLGRIAELEAEAEEAWIKREIELNEDPDYQEAKMEREIEAYEQRLRMEQFSEEEADRAIDWLLETETELNIKTVEIKDELSFFISKKIDVFENVVNNLHKIVMAMSKNKEDYDLLTTLFKRDLTTLNKDSREKVISTLKEEFEKAHKYNGNWGKPPTF